MPDYVAVRFDLRKRTDDTRDSQGKRVAYSNFLHAMIRRNYKILSEPMFSDDFDFPHSILVLTERDESNPNITATDIRVIFRAFAERYRLPYSASETSTKKYY